MAGPQYRYDASNPSPTKFPAWFDGRRFLFDWTQNWVQTTGFDGKAPVGMTRFASAFEFSKPMDMTFGPDGSLYVLEYGNGWGSSNDDSGIYRIDYVEGNRKPVVHQQASTNSGALPLKVDFDASDSTDPDGDALSYAWDFDGDGTTDATTAKASHTYTTAGTFTPRVDRDRRARRGLGRQPHRRGRQHATDSDVRDADRRHVLRVRRPDPVQGQGRRPRRRRRSTAPGSASRTRSGTTSTPTSKTRPSSRPTAPA